MRVRSSIAVLAALFLHYGTAMAADLSIPLEHAPAPHAQEERGLWAAIAYSEADQKYGFFWGADKRQEAIDIAIEHCQNAGGEVCKVVELFRNHRHWDDNDETGFPYYHCGALAISDEVTGQTTPWAAKSAPTRREAEDQALQACEAGEGAECSIREWVCT